MKIIKVLWFIQKVVLEDGSVKTFIQAGFKDAKEVIAAINQSK